VPPRERFPNRGDAAAKHDMDWGYFVTPALLYFEGGGHRPEEPDGLAP
jgi:hypothetical protein